MRIDTRPATRSLATAKPATPAHPPPPDRPRARWRQLACATVLLCASPLAAAVCDFQPVIDRYDFSTASWTRTGTIDLTGDGDGNAVSNFTDNTSMQLSQAIGGVTPGARVGMSWFFTQGDPADSSVASNLQLSYAGVVYWEGNTGSGNGNAPASNALNGATCLSGCDANLAPGVFRTIDIRLPDTVPSTGTLLMSAGAPAVPGDDVRIYDVSVTPTLICLAKQSVGGVGSFDFSTVNAQTTWAGGGNTTAISTSTAGVPVEADSAPALPGAQPLLVTTPGASANVEITEASQPWLTFSGASCDGGLSPTVDLVNRRFSLTSVPLDTQATCTVTNTMAPPDAADDSATLPGGTAGASTNLAGNDTGIQTGAVYTLTGASCSSASVSSAGLASYTAPASGSCTINYQVCAPAPNAGVCDSATLTVTSTAADVAASIAVLPTLSAPGSVVNGEFACTVSVGTATQVGCNASAVDTTGASVPLSIGTCTPAVPASSLANGTVVSCPFSYTAPGTAGGSNTLPTSVSVTAVASATNDSAAGNNIASASAALIDAVNDSAGQPGNTVGQTSSVSGNDGFPPGSGFTLLGGSCANASVSAIGLATYDVPASGSCTVTYELCGPAPDTAVCDSATLTVSAVSSDMGVSLSGLPSVSRPGDTVTGTLTCQASAGDAANVSCGASARDSLGAPLPVSVTGCVVGVTPASLPLASLTNGDSIVCSVSYTTPGTPGGSEVPTTSVTLVGSTGASNDGNSGNNETSVTTPFIDAVDDFSGWPGGSTGATSNLSVNDGFPAGSSFTRLGGSCGNASLTSSGLASYDVPASGTCTVTYEVCAPAPDAGVCDTAVMTVTATPSDMTPGFVGLPAALSPGQAVSVAGGLVCSNVITGADASAAVSATCSASATDSVGQVLPVTVSACQALPPPANPLAVAAALVCDIAFTAPGTAGGEDTTATSVTLTASTSAINDINAGNNQVQAALPLLDAADDFAGVPGGSGSQTTALGINDSYPLGTTVFALTGGSCASAAVSAEGSASYTAPASGSCTVTYQLCAASTSGAPPEPCDDATLTVTATSADMSASVVGLPTLMAPGDTASATLVCSNSAGSAGDATGALCSLAASAGTVDNFSCTPPAGGNVAPGASLICSFDYTTPASGDGGSDAASSFYTLTGTTGATNDDNTANNTTLATVALVDAVDDSTAQPGGLPGASTPLNGNDFPPGALYSLLPGGSCTNTSVSAGGVALYDVPASGSCTVVYEMCGPAPHQAACDSATLTVNAQATTLSALFSGLPSVSTPGQTVNGTLTCTNTGSVLAVGASCSASADNGITPTLNCSPATPSTLAPGGSIVCAVSYTTPGSAGGADTGATQVTLGGSTVAANAPQADTSAAATLIDALDDSLGNIGFAVGGYTASVLSNDTLGAAGASGNVTVTQTGLSGPGSPLTLHSDGRIEVPPNAAIGSYQLSYRICAVSDPSLCDQATATVNVTGAIDAVADVASGAPLQDVEVAVGLNDTTAPGAAISTSGVSEQGGSVSCSAGVALTCRYTPLGTFTGTDRFDYTLCAPAPNATLCDTTTVTLNIGAATPPRPIPLGPWWPLALAVALGAAGALRRAGPALRRWP